MCRTRGLNNEYRYSPEISQVRATSDGAAQVKQIREPERLVVVRLQQPQVILVQVFPS